MKCPNCGYDMPDKKSRCLRCGYTVKDIVLIDPEKIEKENESRKGDKSERREINPDDVRVSRAGGGGFFDSIFGGGGIFGGLGGIFDSLFGGFDVFGSDNSRGYEYDPKYYDDFGNEVYVPDEFERDSVVIHNAELLEEPEKPRKSERPEPENGTKRESGGESRTGASERHGKKSTAHKHGSHGQSERRSPFASYRKAHAERKHNRKQHDD